MSTPNPRRVLVIADALDNQRGGVHVFIRELLDQLHDVNTGAYEYLIVRSVDDDKYPNFRSITIPQYSIPGYASLRLFFIIPIIALYYDCYAVFEPAHFGPFNLPRRIKRITFIHDMTPIIFPQFHTFNGWFLQKLFLKRILLKTDLIVTNSINSKQDIISYVPRVADKVKVNYLGIRALDQDSSISPPEEPYFFCLGTLEPRKNISTLIQAFERVTAEHADVKLLIAGASGWKFEETQDILTQSKATDRIVLLDYVSDADIAMYMQHCISFVYPSQYEGFGLPVLEALSQGAICIVGNNSCMPEIYQDRVLYFESLDAQELSLIMTHALTDGPALRTKLLSDIDHFLSRYSWKDHAQRFERYL